MQPTPPRRHPALVMQLNLDWHPLRARPPRDTSPVDVALLIPLHGSAGIYGPSCELCAEMAAEEINADGGVLGRPLRLRVVDASAPPAVVAARIGGVGGAGGVEAGGGWHNLAGRAAGAPRVGGRGRPRSTAR